MSIEGRANLGPDDGAAERPVRRRSVVKKHRDRIPTPHEVERDLMDVVETVLGSLNEKQRRWVARRVRLGPPMSAYKWALPASLSSTKGESSSTGPAVADDGSVPGSTASVAAAKEPMRDVVAEAAKRVASARTDLHFATKTLERAMNRLSREGYEPGVPFKPKLAPKEMRPLEEAQQRREERGGGFGES